jgi:TolB protein
MNADGSDVTRLTDGGHDYNPGWSPDGTMIAFTRQGVGAQSDIYVMDADGSNVRQLTDGGPGKTNLYPEWSPDGTKIAYVAGKNGGPGGLVIMNPDGSDPVMLVKDGVLGTSWQPVPK